MKIILLIVLAILVALSFLSQAVAFSAFESPLPPPEPSRSLPPRLTDDGVPAITPNPTTLNPDKPSNAPTGQPSDPMLPVDEATGEPSPVLTETLNSESDDDDNGDDRREEKQKEISKGSIWAKSSLWKWIAAWQVVK